MGGQSAITLVGQPAVSLVARLVLVGDLGVGALVESRLGRGPVVRDLMIRAPHVRRFLPWEIVQHRWRRALL